MIDVLELRDDIILEDKTDRDRTYSFYSHNSCFVNVTFPIVDGYGEYEIPSDAIGLVLGFGNAITEMNLKDDISIFGQTGNESKSLQITKQPLSQAYYDERCLLNKGTEIPTGNPTHFSEHIISSEPSLSPSGNPSGEPSGEPSLSPSGNKSKVQVAIHQGSQAVSHH